MNIVEKDFDRWNEVKKVIHYSAPQQIVFGEGDIWWCSLGLNVGSEQDGKNALFERPALVLIKFNEEIALVIPLTSVIKPNPYHYNLDIGFAILSQIRLVSVKRFQRYVKTIPDSELEKTKQQFIEIIISR